MRYFRSPLASFHCAQRNNRITFRKARAAKAGKQELSPRMSSLGEAGRGWEQMLCERKAGLHQRLQVEGLALPSIQQDPQPQSTGTACYS